MQATASLSLFSPLSTKRELLAFCKGRFPGYSKAAKQGKVALLEHVNNWIYSQDDNDVLSAVCEISIAQCQEAIERGNALLGEIDDSEDLTIEECDSDPLRSSLQEMAAYNDPELAATAQDCLEQCDRTDAALAAVEPDRTAPTVAAYTVYLAVITVGTLLLWLLDIPLFAVKVTRSARQTWIDLRLQSRGLEWPQWWLPVMQLAIAIR